MTESEKKEYQKCIHGDGTMSGPEYFWYNFCRIDGKLPEPGSWSEEKFNNYKNTALKLRQGQRKNSVPNYQQALYPQYFSQAKKL